jgi:hypothetical protein
VGESELQSDEDIEAILKIAVARTGRLDSQTLRERLAASATELGLTPEQVAEAEEEWNREEKDRKEIAVFKAHQRKRFNELVGSCAIVAVFLTAVNVITDRTVLWVIWPILAFVVGIAFEARETFFSKNEHFQERFEKWKGKRQDDDQGTK